MKPPSGIAFLSAGAAGALIAAHPDVSRWVVGGHSLGGVVASSYADAGHHGVDGVATVPKGEAQRQIEAATLSLLRSVDERG